MSDIYFILFYGVIFIIVLYLILDWLSQSVNPSGIARRRILSMLRPSTVIVTEQPTDVPLWPWPITTYNWWPYWLGGYYAGGGGGSYGGTTRVYSAGRPWGGAGHMANHGAGHGGHGGHGGGGHGGGGHSGH